MDGGTPSVKTGMTLNSTANLQSFYSTISSHPVVVLLDSAEAKEGVCSVRFSAVLRAPILPSARPILIYDLMSQNRLAE